MQPITQISSYKKETFSAILRNGKQATHDIYSIGDGAKVVVIIQELPGIGQETLALADRFVGEGFKVVLPHLFGPIGRTATFGNLIRVFCMRKEFKLFAKNESSPVIDFLAALCQKVKEEESVKGVAVIGMCLTGNFAISLMGSEAVLAGYASQPSLPLMKQEALHMSEEEVSKIKQRLDELGPMHCGRFEGDKFCTGEKFALFDRTFNSDGKQRMIFHELPGDKHAILTLDFVDEKGHPTQKAFNEVLAYFNQQLIE